MEVIQYLFLPIQPFVWHPERIVIVSGVFFLGFIGICLLNRKHVQFQHWLLLVCAIIWGVFAIWEANCKAMEYNIRVDLLLIYPVLMSFSVFSIVINIIRPSLRFRRKQKNSEDRDA